MTGGRFAGALWRTKIWYGDSPHDLGMGQPRPGLVRPVRLDPTGREGPTRGQARNRKSWRSGGHGFYLPTCVDSGVVEQRILEASVAVPPGHGVTGWAALRWIGGAWFTGFDAAGSPLPIDVLTGVSGARAREGILRCGECAGPRNVVLIDEVPITMPAWSVVFMMRRARTLHQAVRALDMAAYSDLVSLAEAAEVVERQAHWTGVPQARDALARACENAWSPAETSMRLAWEVSIEGSRPQANLPLFDAVGRHIGTPDLIDVAAGVAADYDSVIHLDREQRRSDRTRDEVFADHGIEMVRWLSGDHRDSFLARLHRAHERARRRRGERSWTAQPPPHWVDTTSVTARRSLTQSQRQRLLRYRRDVG